MIDIENIQKTAEAYREIEAHAQDLKTLGKLMEIALKNNEGLNIVLYSNDCNEKEDSNTKGVSDNIYPKLLFATLNSDGEISCGAQPIESKQEKEQIDFSTEINDVLSIEILGILIREKQNTIKKLFQKIKQ